jgi:hypothetical protein
MVRQPPLSLILMGLASAVFASAYLLWLLLYAWPDLQELIAAAFGDAAPLPDLVQNNLASTTPVRTAFVFGAVRAALMLAVLATGVGLLRHCRWARLAGIFGGALVIAVTVTGTVVRLWFLTLPGGAVKVTPLIMDALAVLFANVLCGTMFLPGVTAAYAGFLEPTPPPGSVEPSDRPSVP